MRRTATPPISVRHLGYVTIVMPPPCVAIALMLRQDDIDCRPERPAQQWGAQQRD